jgi:hypothetical protein
MQLEISDPMDDEDNSMMPSGVKRCLLIVFAVGVFLMLILLPMSFGDVEYYQVSIVVGLLREL